MTLQKQLNKIKKMKTEHLIEKLIASSNLADYYFDANNLERFNYYTRLYNLTRKEIIRRIK